MIPSSEQSQDPREIEPVKRVAARIIEAAKRSKYAEMAKQFQWEVTVIKDDKTMNALHCRAARSRCIPEFSRLRRQKQDWPRSWGMKSSMLWPATVQNG